MSSNPTADIEARTRAGDSPEEDPLTEPENAFERLERLVGGEVEVSSSEPSIYRGGVVIGELAGFDDAGAPLVRFPQRGEARELRALTLRPLDDGWIGRAIALQFVDGDPRRPLILGPLIEPGPAPAKRSVAVEDGVEELSAKRKLTLRCGEASLVLTHDGKVLIRGTYVSSRSSGMQRIRGGSVCIN